MNAKTKKLLIALGCVAAAVLLFFAGFFTYYLTLDEGLRSLLWFKNKVQDEYYENISDEDFWNAAISGAEGLLDEYSTLYTADEYDVIVSSSKGEKLGAGLSFFADTNLIYKVAVNSPAFFAGMEEGTYITGVGMSREEFVSTFTPTELSKALDDISSNQTFYLRASADSADDTENVKIYEVQKKAFTESYAVYQTYDSSWALVEGENGMAWEKYGEGNAELDEDTAYVRLVQFYGNAYDSFAHASEQYKADGKTKLILDLRNNGGGSVDVMQSLSNFLLKDAKEKKNLVMTAQYRGGREEKYYSRANYYDEYFADSKIYVMANHNSASASEALIGAMISYGTIGYGDIFLSKIGNTCKTFGKGIMQTTFSNPLTGEAAKLTTAKIFWPNGHCIHGVGVTEADGATPIETTGATVYGDPELSKVLARI